MGAWAASCTEHVLHTNTPLIPVLTLLDSQQSTRRVRSGIKPVGTARADSDVF